MVGLVAFELALEDGVCVEHGQILDKDVHKFSWPLENLLFDSWVRGGPELISTRTQVFSRRVLSAAVAM